MNLFVQLQWEDGSVSHNVLPSSSMEYTIDVPTATFPIPPRQLNGAVNLTVSDIDRPQRPPLSMAYPLTIGNNVTLFCPSPGTYVCPVQTLSLVSRHV